MSAIAAVRKLIDELEVKYRSGVSESTWFKIGGVINFIVTKNHQEKQFFLNGKYSLLAMPQNKVDGLTIFEYDATIINAWLFNIVAGSSGVTEIDCRIKPQNSGSYTSIFSTRPQIAAAAGNDAWIGVGQSFANMTAPVLSASPLNVNAGDGLVVDLIQAQAGGQNCGLLIHYRPR